MGTARAAAVREARPPPVGTASRAALDGAATVIVIGTGLTMVDIVSVDDGGRVVHAVSRNGLPPRSPAERPVAAP